MSTSEIQIYIPEGWVDRLDKALATHIPAELGISRSRLQELIQSGAVSQEGQTCTNPKQKTKGDEHYTVIIPPSKPSEIIAQDIPLDIVYEDEDLLVVNKPAGMVVHPARGAEDGTLVNALLHHIGEGLSSIGGVERPGIVHRIDKDTSGLLVVAKNDRTHEGLGLQFRAHSIERLYTAFCYGALDLHNPRILGLEGVSLEAKKLRIDLPIGRHKTDRLRMAIRNEGKHAVTHILALGQDEAGLISKVECALETGRTHQIRVHLHHIGHPLLGDPTYGKGGRAFPKNAPDILRQAIHGLQGQALHAGVLGFTHPISGETLRFERKMPPDMEALDLLIQK